MWCAFWLFLLVCFNYGASQLLKIAYLRHRAENGFHYKNITEFNITEDTLGDFATVMHIKALDKINGKRIVISNFENLHSVYILESGLYFLPKFIGLEWLEEVYIRDNNFFVMTKDMVEGINMLHLMRLINNKITAIEFHFFGPEISRVDLRCNQLDNFNTDWFTAPSKLVVLNLSGNQIKTLPENVFQEFTQLNEINLSFNDLIEIGDNAFTNRKSFWLLSLSYNHLREFPLDMFLPGEVWVENFNFEFNNLTFLPKKWMRSVKLSKAAWIDGNPWQCVCYWNFIIKWMSWNGYGDYSPKDRKDEPRCVVNIGSYKDKCVEASSSDLIDYFVSVTSPPPNNKQKHCECVSKTDWTADYICTSSDIPAYSGQSENPVPFNHVQL